jgi:hypothetical protein
MSKVQRYNKWEGNNEIQVQIIKHDEKPNWLVAYRFGLIEREEYFANGDDAWRISDWATHQGYRVTKLTPVELL